MEDEDFALSDDILAKLELFRYLALLKYDQKHNKYNLLRSRLA